jgi:hypothetical protein
VHKSGNFINTNFYYFPKFSGMGGVILVILALLGCSATSPSRLKQMDAVIFQKWLHSYEEDTKDMKVYRPSSFDFPRGWGRVAMKFDEKGGFILYDIAPNDAIVQVIGTWRQISDGKLKISFPSAEKEDFMMEVEEINSEILKVRK